jgi:hypothetical protein
MSTIKAAVAKREEERPPLPKGTPVLSIYATPVIRRDSDHPSQCYLDVTFLANDSNNLAIADIEAIIFKNYYTSSIKISTPVDGSGSSTAGSTFLPILEDKSIMASPYYENGSQDWITIYTSEFNDNYIPGKPLRFTLIQPCPTWKAYEIRYICAVGKLPNSITSACIADGGVPLNGADSETAWRNRSISSLIKADATFLLQKAMANNFDNKASPSLQELILDTAPAFAGASSTGKMKKKGKDKIKKVGGVSLAGGGTKKEVAVTDGDEKDNELVSDTEPT